MSLGTVPIYYCTYLLFSVCVRMCKNEECAIIRILAVASCSLATRISAS